MSINKIITIGAWGYIGKLLLNISKPDRIAYGTSSTWTAELPPLRLDTPADFDYGLIQLSDVVLLTAEISAPDICSREHACACAVNVTGTSKLFYAQGLTT